MKVFDKKKTDLENGIALFKNVRDHQNDRNYCDAYIREECNEYEECFDCIIGRVARFFGILKQMALLDRVERDHSYS